MTVVSVLVAAYGCAAYIRECIASIASQDLLGGELDILVGADDDERVVAELDHGAIDDLVAAAPSPCRLSVWHCAPRSGAYVVRNGLIARSVGDPIAIFDGDDVMLPGRLREMATSIDLYAHICGTGYQLVDRDLEPLGEPTTNRYADGAIMYRRAVIDRLGGYQPWECGADTELLVRARRAGLVDHIITEPLFLYRQHGAQLTSQPTTSRESAQRRRRVLEISQADQGYVRGGPVPSVDPVVPRSMRLVASARSRQLAGMYAGRKAL